MLASVSSLANNFSPQLAYYCYCISKNTFFLTVKRAVFFVTVLSRLGLSVYKNYSIYSPKHNIVWVGHSWALNYLN